MAGDKQEFETSGEFLAALGQRLRETADVDGELVEVLITNLLTESPAADATVVAADAIEKLAKTRAAPAVEPNDD